MNIFCPHVRTVGSHEVKGANSTVLPFVRIMIRIMGLTVVV